MKTNDEFRDTIINVINYRDEICILGPECKIHNHQIIDSMIYLKSKTPENYNSIVDGKMIYFHVNEFGDTMTIEPTANQKTVQQINFVRFDSDTIQPCDSNLLKFGDNRLTSEFIIWPKQHVEKKEIQNYDGICFGMTLGFMTFISLKYLFDSFDNWIEFFNELKTTLKS